MNRQYSDTAGKLVAGAADLIMRGGYNGFSYADLAERFAIRKASIHHHFPSKTDLVIAAIDQARAATRAQVAQLQDGTVDAMDQLLRYTGFWQSCITDQSMPFCLAGVLAAELPSLPPDVAAAVRGHFSDLAGWMKQVLAQGRAQGTMRFAGTPGEEAERFIAAVYGAMLAARAFDDPARFGAILAPCVDRLRA
ncbi:TetR/AcrR family transcriptional regulator [Acidisoma silvae]|uniref:TetR/AcrR family transcriptional regulator n=1 Tax=Acidisoma silvae TaxID=2802396 RepID=A0A964DZF1_9PROT|nr:TetR/AcrR family transcriptional regulator [Acidisoma silvae]MCB8876029.1 TetR/AcrR family transcriptional regulator [Acidisoma silvae]